MTQDSKTPDASGTPRTPPDSGRRTNPQLISDGVIAGYIHEISERQRDWRRRTDEQRRRRPWQLDGASSDS